MTIENLLFRFLKENGLYNAIKKELCLKNKVRKERPKHLLDTIIFSSSTFKNYKLECAFYLTFNSFRIFCGDSASYRRRRFYRLNKKWKDFVGNKCFFVQHNIKIGDVITYKVLRKNYTAKVIEINGMYFKVKSVDTNYESMRNIFTITEINGVKATNNLYYKDKNGNCYGKIDGTYDEVQL